MYEEDINGLPRKYLPLAFGKVFDDKETGRKKDCRILRWTQPEHRVTTQVKQPDARTMANALTHGVDVSSHRASSSKALTFKIRQNICNG